jgi:hypothetical protein
MSLSRSPISIALSRGRASSRQGWRLIARKQACIVRRGSAPEGRRAIAYARPSEAQIQALMRLSGLAGQLFGVLALIVAYYIGPELDNFGAHNPFRGHRQSIRNHIADAPV